MLGLASFSMRGRSQAAMAATVLAMLALLVPLLSILSSAVIALVTLLLWVVSLPLRNSSIVDIFWGIGFVLVAWVTFLALPERTPRSFLVALLTSLWGLRLAGYLAWRNLGNSPSHKDRP